MGWEDTLTLLAIIILVGFCISKFVIILLCEHDYRTVGKTGKFVECRKCQKWGIKENHEI